MVDRAGPFLSEFSGLVMASDETRRVLTIDGELAAGHSDPDWCQACADDPVGRLLRQLGSSPT